MFRGSFEHAIDDKGRLSIPARYREILKRRRERELILVDPLFDACIVAYPIKAWQQIEQNLLSHGNSDRKFREYARLISAHAVESTVDSQGRILIPPQLREKADLRRDVVIVGVLDKIEIWNRERWTSFCAQERDPEDYAGKLAELGIRV
ncbi:MAG: division/cell wall cluster transcriptional repressor MraZ [Candidatus Methylomirabilis oxygeniifera]|uniref:Transcriptional regulator MraZ n=1 Tax=Methylomirabilis oxygeniifera TaxID=671143 RepID=D5MI65_METO1|nr:MAG: division/cell wall cluster transcriptional repressor MraZ [Candidatus Methylomirabilis oxyfera]MDD5559463.1 division/cell wall cluster transcriptional repressor MraZ [Candidatus Methylomirabilis sp.]CBE69358.1 Protein mraZ [Candidatus Methylomirabilis oxyfera]